MKKISLKHIGITILVLKATLIIFLLVQILPTVSINDFKNIDSQFFGFLVAGFIAQIIDGALGMAYGVSCSTLLLYFGVSPKLATAAVHTAEVFTTGVSGLSHLHLNNLDKPLFFRLLFTGVGGAMIGAYLISQVFDGATIKPFIAVYLLILGAVIITKGIRNRQKPPTRVKNAEMLAFFGGFLDAVGGGGWGPIVTSNILSQGKNPNETIGTVNTAEFFVSFFSTGVFLFFVGIQSWKIVAALIIGGIIAAPLGALFAKNAKRKTLMLLAGSVIIITSLITLYKTLMQ